jgi:diaminohydroxyphosphoribosylaminopyrimidine deaminase / 5-amino-6-(5-phosphoribosylamino)uracil reductase
VDHEELMRLAITEAELARGTTGDNPWVGCVLVDAAGAILARGHTQGPGEDHAEIAALRDALAAGLVVEGTTMYSTLEPCAFHGRTPACSRVIVDHRIRRVITGMRDPNPRVDGEGARILRDAGVEVIEGVCEREVRRQLGGWVLAYHPHEPARRALALGDSHPVEKLADLLSEIYAVPRADAERIVARALAGASRS